jgi:hypothetical protein
MLKHETFKISTTNIFYGLKNQCLRKNEFKTLYGFTRYPMTISISTLKFRHGLNKYGTSLNKADNVHINMTWRCICAATVAVEKQ